MILVLTEKSSEDLRQMQLAECPIGPIFHSVEKREKPRSDDVRQEGAEALHLLQLWKRLSIQDGILKWQYEDNPQQYYMVAVSCSTQSERRNFGRTTWTFGRREDVAQVCKTM